MTTRNGIEFSRHFGMPSMDTFDCKPIGDFVRKYLEQSRVSIDPFARNKQWATYTNDLNPNTQAECHLKALDFLQHLLDKKIKADLIIFDPPYSITQVKQCYESFGIDFFQKDAQNSNWHRERKITNQLLKMNGICLSFGWNSIGMGMKRGYTPIEILLAFHGRAHNDTLCMAEKKVSHQEVFQF